MQFPQAVGSPWRFWSQGVAFSGRLLRKLWQLCAHHTRAGGGNGGTEIREQTPTVTQVSINGGLPWSRGSGREGKGTI